MTWPSVGTEEDGMEGDDTYMAKELLNSGPGGKQCTADMLSFGLLLYEMASGRHGQLPCGGDEWHSLRQVL